MNAIELKQQIDTKIDNVARTIAFSYEEKYFDKIIQRVKNILYYIYDNEDYQIDRLENIELVEIAKEFAKDITEELTISEQEKETIEEKIANLIWRAKDIGVSQFLIKKIVSEIPLLNVQQEESITKIERVIDYYKNDYKVKEIINVINESMYKKRSFNIEIIQQKSKILKEELNLEYIDDENIRDIWNLLEVFNPYVETVFEDDFYVSKKEKFYEIIGCVGDDLAHLEDDAILKGRYMDATRYKRLKGRYNKLFNEVVRDYYKHTSNVSEIFEDLNGKGYTCNEDVISTFLNESRHISGINFNCYDSDGVEYSAIIYNNNYSLYSKDFIETCIHEFIHAIGGVNKKYKKKGLHYGNSFKFIHLEEAYANFLAKQLAKLYFENYGVIVEIKCKETLLCTYDRTLEYFSVVWDLYRKELQEIHISENISYKEALKILPALEEIADGLNNIMNAKDKNINAVSKQEIEKLTRRKKR